MARGMAAGGVECVCGKARAGLRGPRDGRRAACLARGMTEGGSGADCGMARAACAQPVGGAGVLALVVSGQESLGAGRLLLGPSAFAFCWSLGLLGVK